MKENQFIMTIKAEDRPGLLHLVTGVIEKKLIPVESLNYAPTDIHDIILITVEVSASESDVTQLALKLENIIEVFAVEVKQFDSMVCLRAAYFKMAKTFLESPAAIVLSKYDTVIVQIYPEAILLAKYGTDLLIRKLYNALDGPHLLGFSQTGLISESNLIQHDDIERIIRLAA
jgi:acetolactate synthase small subunit